MNKVTMVVSLLATLVPMAAHADPPPQMAEVAPLIGRWSGSGTLTSGGESHPVQATYSCERVSDGFGLSCTGEMTGIPGLAAYKWRDMWGYSAGDGLFHWYTVTNAGETHDHRGTVENGHVFVQFEGPQDGSLFSERVTMDFVAGKKLTIGWDVVLDGKTTEQGQVTFSPARS